MLPILEAITSNHPRCITSQDIVPRIDNNANTLERTLSLQCILHAVWISLTHLRGVKILIHPSHNRVLVCTPSVTLPYQSPASGLTDFCHDRMKSLSFASASFLTQSGYDCQNGLTLDSRTRQDQGMSQKWSVLDTWSHLSHHHDAVN